MKPSESGVSALRPIGDDNVERETVRLVTWRLVPLIFVAWFVNYLDRANISFAALQMNQELGMGPEMFGFAAGIFYLGYIGFEVPSNMLMHRFGARAWLARIMVTWGIVSAATAFVQTPQQLYGARLMLGVVEAGFFPCVLYYLALWFPKQHLGRAISRVYSANIVSLIIGGPLSALLISHFHEASGFSGWRWMMMIEGIPAVVLGVIAWFVLVDRPADARWLSAEQRQWLVGAMAGEEAISAKHGVSSFRSAMTAPMVWLMGLLYFCIGIGFFGISTWLPQVIKQMSSLSIVEIGLVSAIPFVLGAIAMLANARHSDRTMERRWHLAGALFIGAAGLAGSGLTSNLPLASFACICVAAAGIVGSLSVFWTIPPTFLAGAGAAGGMALINAISGLAGFFAPWLVGVARGRSPDFTVALYCLAASVAVAAILAMILPYGRSKTDGNVTAYAD
ncbi:MFS transporter [Pandoraea cepalis]|uniref:MFS transporter n=2 Tax=Pandoraea TaxID=93217 RepID=A0AAW7MPR4_9BURK|nr:MULTISPECIES: MFS transporter [Pandoraea]MDN4574771.1 MFS transporter [Pandoraea cepalis]MDN4580274.1 MFS transporter [Pandoraea cepalis]VVE06060.1 Putative tartrate transporter [Pandoraea terrigena]